MPSLNDAATSVAGHGRSGGTCRDHIDRGVYLDGALVIDNWGEHESRTVAVAHDLTAGHHRIRIEYEQLLGDARLEIRCDSARQGVMQPLASNDLSPEPPTLPNVSRLRPLVSLSLP
jgi:hypothetical protein